MESSTNRFVDNDDLPVDDRDLKQLMADCEKWSHKNDLQLLSHLKQMSNNLINKTENTNHSIENLVFETKMHCVKVDNVINEFQMLANSQFVENRVYDEEMEEIITSGQNLPNEELVSNKNKDEEVLNRIKVALNIGLTFLNQRFDCVSNKVSQNDSDDENDEILEGLISNSARDEFSQRLLPYIIGSDDFINDNNVGLSYIEESPAIDLKSRIDNDFNAKSVDSFESKSDISGVRNTIPSIANNFIDDINDSEDESNDLFGTLPKTLDNKQKSVSISNESDSDSDPFISEHKEISKPEIEDSNQFKPSMPSFQDELSAAITAKNSDKNSLFDSKVKESKPESVVNQSLTKSFDSESSDENDSIFNVTKTKPKLENKPKNNFSNLFGDEPNDEPLFGQTNDKKTSDNNINKVLPNLPKSQKVAEKTSNLFDEDDDDEDDLFGAINKKITKTPKPKVTEKKPVSNSVAPSVSDKKISKPIVSKTSLFSDDEEEDDLFGAIPSKSKQNNVQNSDAFETIVKPTISSPIKVSKPTDSLIGELSSALKKKGLFQSDDEESDSNSDDDFKIKTNSIETNKIDDKFQIKTEREVNSLNTEEEVEDKEENDSLFNEDIITISDKNSSKVANIETNDIFVSKSSNPLNQSNNDFYSEGPTLTLANDGLKHRAALGAQRNRRPPSKKLLKLTPITDFDQNSETKEEIITNSEEKSVPKAAIRTVKTTVPKSMSEEIDEYQSDSKSLLSIDKTFESISSLVKSPSTEEDDIFPTQTNTSKNQNISKIFEKSENPSTPLFDDSGDNEESLFKSNKTLKNDNSKRSVDTKSLFDTSDSDDDNFFSKKSSNIISNIIKPSNSELFNDVSSTDSSLSNKSDLKIGNSKPTVSLFSDSDDEDLFSAVSKSKTTDKSPQKQSLLTNDERPEKLEKRKVKTIKSNSLFSDNEDDDTSDLFDNKDIKTKSKTNAKPIFDLEDDDDEDIFAPKPSTAKTTISSKNKPRKESQSSDLFDDPLFASRS